MNEQQRKVMEKALLVLAQRKLGLDTLETRNRDALDFHDLAVWDIKEALELAYSAGMAAAARK